MRSLGEGRVLWCRKEGSIYELYFYATKTQSQEQNKHKTTNQNKKTTKKYSSWPFGGQGERDEPQ